MGASSLFLMLFTSSLFSFSSLVSGSSFSEFIYPNFSASNLQFVDKSGAFLFSRNETFQVAIFNPRGQQNYFYLCIIHVATNTVIWSANRDAPISNSGQIALSPQGIAVSDQYGNLKWSTPPLASPVFALQLTELGNIVLLNKTNATLWNSFHHPTDTIVIGQRVPVGATLSSSVSGDDLSTGDYRLLVTSSDVILQWQGQTYWKLSMYTKAYLNKNSNVDYMAINRTGLFLFGQNGSAVVIEVILHVSNFRIVQLAPSGQLLISSFVGTQSTQELAGPSDQCRIPFICGSIGLCTNDASKNPTCSCPSGFRAGSQNSSGCVPSDGSSLQLACNSTNNVVQLNSSEISYLMLGYGMDYFATDFTLPVKYGASLSTCQDSCTSDCSCMGFFYDNSSGSCFALDKVVGSVSWRSSSDMLGYIKALVGSSSIVNNSFNSQRQNFPVIALVLLPFTGVFLIVAFVFLWWRRTRIASEGKTKLGSASSTSSGDLDGFHIPGLPERFKYEELELATDNFKTQIGSGGFGAVYKGTLPDKSVVAVKKINSLGFQGKQEFCTEIAVIGNIHHVNLVKLRGFCTRGRKRLLVYEYMNRGSLDKTLFGCGPPLEWQERFEIALGSARGLAYLHTGCEQKIIHCDVKPENILLHDNFQAKISDFGLSKLLSPEQSSLFTTMRGTRGYLAPEWLTNSAISEKTDVYSYGMVLLELVSGRKNCYTRSQSHSRNESSSGGGGESTPSSGPRLVYFPLFALEMHEKGRYLELADPSLEGRVTREEVEKLVRIALCCVHEEPALRPNMVSVVAMLEGCLPLGRPRMESLSFLRFYGQRYIEASMIEGNEQSSILLYPEANTSATGTPIGSNVGFSFISSQQISGPR